MILKLLRIMICVSEHFFNIGDRIFQPVNMHAQEKFTIILKPVSHVAPFLSNSL